MFSGQDLVKSLRMTQLNDPDSVTWSDLALIDVLNEALRMLILVRPDASSKVAVMPVRDGTRQSIPDDGIRLLRVIRNINDDDGAGLAVRLVQQEDMDGMSPDWHTMQGYIVKEYMYDVRTPRQFYIYPAVTPASKLEIEYSCSVTKITGLNFDGPFPVSEIFSQPIQELMLYKLLSGDATNGQSGATHLQTAMELLGIKDTADERVSSARRTSN